MIITNVKIYTENQRFQEGFISIKDGRFDKIQTGEQSAISPTEEIFRRGRLLRHTGIDRSALPRMYGR